ncbi:MAG: ATP/GTP-binding protein [Actinomycetota bacterium]|nr:ATP/GTP-binding protein [Actinomycetota bacterium]
MGFLLTTCGDLVEIGAEPYVQASGTIGSMPRRNRRLDPDTPKGAKQGATFDPSKMSETIAGPAWSRVDGYQVLESVNRSKIYRCPYCQGVIQAGTPHLVVIPVGRMEDRRHYHTACWAKQEGLRRPSR